MTIKYGTHNLVKRIINWHEVEKVIYNGEEIRPNDYIINTDFRNLSSLPSWWSATSSSSNIYYYPEWISAFYLDITHDLSIINKMTEKVEFVWNGNSLDSFSSSWVGSSVGGAGRVSLNNALYRRAGWQQFNIQPYTTYFFETVYDIINNTVTCTSLLGDTYDSVVYSWDDYFRGISWWITFLRGITKYYIEVYRDTFLLEKVTVSVE